MTINPTPVVNARYGAPTGRHSASYLACEAGKIHLQRIRIDSGGYDAGGAYWGLGQPLWCAMDQDGNTLFFRAPDRATAKARILADWPNATFFR
jgi:hypothetical protein